MNVWWFNTTWINSPRVFLLRLQARPANGLNSPAQSPWSGPARLSGLLQAYNWMSNTTISHKMCNILEKIFKSQIKYSSALLSWIVNSYRNPHKRFFLMDQWSAAFRNVSVLAERTFFLFLKIFADSWERIELSTFLSLSVLFVNIILHFQLSN